MPQINPVPTKQMIPTRRAYWSCVGVLTEFPRGWGNYFGTTDGNVTYHVVNLGCEDLEDAIALGLVGDTIEADVYCLAEEPESDIHRVAYITDSRLPEICLTPMWWYSERHPFQVTIVRRKFNVPDDLCSCEYPASRKAILHPYHSSMVERPGYCVTHSNCVECGTKYTTERQLNKEETICIQQFEPKKHCTDTSIQ